MRELLMKDSTGSIDLSGLDGFVVSDLMRVGVADTNCAGAPLELPIEQVIEDERQARGQDNPGFRQESLDELAASIAASGGLKSPISVRPKDARGLFVINHGARRLRASKLAGFKTIRAFIDSRHDDYDQAVENIQREAFTPMEIALFIERRERLGDERSVIAKRLGKSRAYVTRYAALLALSEPLRTAYDSGRCQDALALYNLSTLSKSHPRAVESYVQSSAEITRTSVEALKRAVEPKRDGAPRIECPPFKDHTGATAVPPVPREERVSAQVSSIVVIYKSKRLTLRPELPASSTECGWVEDASTGSRTEVDLRSLRIESIWRS